MFRMGGSSGTGITSGLDRPGYKRAGQVTGQRIFDATNPEGVFRTTASEMLAANKLANAPQETAFDIASDAQSRIDLANRFAPRTTAPFSPGSLSGFLTSTGLNLLSATPRGNIFATAAEAARQATFLPQEQLDRFAAQVTGIMGGYPAQFQSTNVPNPTPLQTALGIGTTLAGVYGAFSKPGQFAGNFNFGPGKA